MIIFYCCWNTFNVTTCWANAILDQTIGEILDVLFAAVQDVLDEIVNPFVKDYAASIAKMNNIAVEIPSFPSFDYPSAIFHFKEICRLEFKAPSNLQLSLQKLELNLDVPKTVNLGGMGLLA